MNLELDHETEGRYDILVPHGDVDIASHTVLRDRLAQLLDQGRSDLVVDLSDTGFIDSTALGCLIGARARAVADDGSFAVITEEPRIVKLLEITRLSELLTRYDTRTTWRGATTG